MALNYPLSTSDIYLARGSEVTGYRPVIQGDIYEGVEIPGVESTAQNLGMILTHPCSMRRGPHLVERLTIVRVKSRAPFPLSKWADGFYYLMPLPELIPVQEDDFYAASFEEAGLVPAANLTLDNRIAVLSPQGLMLMEQRLVFHFTRVVIDIPTLMKRSENVLEEAELLEEWNESLLADAPKEDLETRLRNEAVAFDRVLSTQRISDDGQEKFTFRDRLKSPAHRAGVRKAIRGAINERLQNRQSGGHRPRERANLLAGPFDV